MIRISDLQEAIAECQGEKNPNAQTCIKLAAYYTILKHLTDKPAHEPYQYSTAQAENPVIYLQSGSEFAEIVNGRDALELMPLIDELVQSVGAVVPALYEAFIRKLKK